MNLGELRTDTRFYLNEASPIFWSNAELNAAINKGCTKVFNLIKSLSRYHHTARVTFPLVVNQDYYNLPADLKDLRLVTKIAADDGTELPLDRAYMPNPFPWTQGSEIASSGDSSTSDPTGYMLVGKYIRFLPVPTSTTTIRLYYEARLVSLTADADVPAFELDYHDMASLWAAILSRPKNEEDATDLKELFKEREGDLIRDMIHHAPNPYTDTQSYLQGMP